MSSDNEDKSGEVISFEKAGHVHVHQRKEEKLSKMKAAFKAVTRERLKESRKARRKSGKKKKKR